MHLKFCVFNSEVCDTLFEVNDIENAVKHLKCNKSDGLSGIYSDHFVHGTSKLYELITKFVMQYCYMVIVQKTCYRVLLYQYLRIKDLVVITLIISGQYVFRAYCAN
jgi:hypothetical protein